MKKKIAHIIKTFVHGIVICAGSGFIVTQLFAEEVKELSGTQWRLVEFQSMDDATGTLLPDDPNQYKMKLNRDGTVTMKLNCNRANGNWSATPGMDSQSGQFEFGLLASTKALCPPPSMDGHIINNAKYIRSYLLKDGRLYLSLMADAGIYAWEPDSDKTSSKIIYSAPEEGGPRNWEVTGITNDRLNLRETPSVKAKIIDRYPLGTILDNLGCQKNDEGQIWCDVQKLGGGSRGYVSSRFLMPSVSPDGSISTGPDDSALRAGQEQFDATGKILCTDTENRPMEACEFGVARAGGGYATVVVKRPNSYKRAIYFRMGKAIGADTSQADGYPEFTAKKEGDTHLINIGNEQYEISDAVIFGD